VVPPEPGAPANQERIDALADQRRECFLAGAGFGDAEPLAAAAGATTAQSTLTASLA